MSATLDATPHHQIILIQGTSASVCDLGRLERQKPERHPGTGVKTKTKKKIEMLHWRTEITVLLNLIYFFHFKNVKPFIHQRRL